MARIRLCPRCRSSEVVRLPNDGISPHPGYECKSCLIHMRPNGSTIIWIVALIVSLGVAIFSVMPLFVPIGDRIFIALPIIALIVAGYSIHQLFRPTPVLVDTDAQV